MLDADYQPCSTPPDWTAPVSVKVPVVLRGMVRRASPRDKPALNKKISDRLACIRTRPNTTGPSGTAFTHYFRGSVWRV